MKINKIITGVVIAFTVMSSIDANATVKLPRLISDGMVLQRDVPLKIWGWADANEKVKIEFLGKTYQVIADKQGNWKAGIPAVAVGGPYSIKVNEIEIKDVLIGDVWVCSGQSNMQFPLRGSTIYQDDIAQSENTNIRQFLVGQGFKLGSKETDNRSGKWISANPGTVTSFTAVGYFFAKKLYELYKIPIGLINASVGGSSAEAWISEDGIKEFPRYYEDVQKFQMPGYLDKVKKQDDERVKAWNQLVKQNDEGNNGPLKWYDPTFNPSDWETMHVPDYWNNSKTGNVNGFVWFRREFDVPAQMIGKQAILKLGRIADADSVFINGKFVGSVNSLYSLRSYKVPDYLLKDGSNTIVVKITSLIHHGGFVPGRPYQLIADADTIKLEGDWKYKVGAITEPLEDRLFTGKIPTGLFNGMLAPITNYTIKGAVWYQGESNTIRAFEHFEIFKELIKDWRNNWHQGNFPFIYVQLPNFVEENFETTKCDWAYLRETQLKALSIPNTGMAVTINIGEFNDIHPVKKKPVGERLALAAQKVAYGDNKVVYSGPIYKSSEIKGNQVTLSFINIGGGLIAKGGELKCFEICGIDNQFVLANAEIVNDKIVVAGDGVEIPVAVRYAWANNPEGVNLFNKEGLPASPFRTSELY